MRDAPVRSVPLRTKAAGVFALVALAWAMMMIPPGANQTAHFATVVALAHGSPSIDAERTWTGDTAYVHGHFYAAKAPGLALATVPWYLALKHLGLVQPTPSPEVTFPRAQETFSRTDLWEVALWGSMLPALILLALVFREVERLVPGYGIAAGISVGAASVLAVLATMFFDHALSACLGFAAFVFLSNGRRDRSRNVAVAGLLAGLAITAELPLALVAAALGVYTIARQPRLRHLGAYAAGVAAGVLPLAAFNAWAFGSPFTLAYSHAVAVPGRTGHDVLGQNASGFFGVGLPRPHGLIELLFSGYGLLVIAPVWTAAAVGLVLLWRIGAREECLLVSALAVAFLVYNSGYKDLFGAMSTGPRFLAPIIPFLALPLAATWRRAPLTVAALLVASAIVTWTMIAANPMGRAEDPGTFFQRLIHGGQPHEPLSGTVLHWLWPRGNIPALLAIMALAAVAVGLAIALTPWRITRWDAAFALAALVAWRVLYVAGPTILKVDKNTGRESGAIAVALIVAALAAGLWSFGRERFLVAVPTVMLLPLAWARVDGKPVVAGALALLALTAMAVVTIARGRWARGGELRPG